MFAFHPDLPVPRVEFALVDRTALMSVQKFDWIFDGDDVVGLRFVYQIDYSREG